MNKNKLRSTVVTLIVAMVLIGMMYGAMAAGPNEPNPPKEGLTVSTVETNYPAVEPEPATVSASSWVTYTRNYPAYAWDGVTYADDSLTGYDDHYLTYTMPWTFTFFGAGYDLIHINTNGVISFPPDFYVGLTPYDVACIAPYWGDLTQSRDVGCYIKVQEKTGPNRVVIEYYTDSYSPDSAGKNLFEVILYQDGIIRYDYNYLNDPPSYAPSARISDGTTRYTNTYRHATSVTYTPSTRVSPGTGTVNINSIDSSSFPYITVYASATGDDGASIGGLDAYNFCLKEDSTGETITVTDIASGGGSMADIVFVFDDTGSMSGQINDLKDTCISFADNLDASGIDYRLGLVTFKDDVTVINDRVLTSDATEFKGWIEGLYASGGADWAENSLDALGTATTYSFRPSAQKIFILITDAPPHYDGDGGDSDTVRTVAGTITELQAAGAMTFVVGPDRSEYHSVGSISEETGGTWYAITADFTSIIGAIGDVITHQYVIEYYTHNSAFDGMWRDVLLCLDLDGIDPCSCDVSDAGGYTAPDSTGINININSIDASGCSDISVYVSVTDSEGYSIGGLDEGNFEIYESGSDMSPITVTDIASGGGASADIVFVFDDTGSMGWQIDGLKAKAIDFANSLESSSIDYRLGLVTFKDDVTVINGGVLTDEAILFNDWVNDLYADGGGDTPENSLDALGTATTYSFRSGVQKIFILITDASAHYTGDGTTYTDRTVAGTIAELQAAGAMTFVVGPDIPQYHGAGSISCETWGRWYSIDDDFVGIIDDIGTVITHQYRIDYTTPDTADGTTRMVAATVYYAGASASDIGSYTSDCPTGTGLYLHIDGKNCVNMPFVARLTDSVGNPIDGGTIIFNLGGAQFIQTTGADGYATFTPTVTGTLLAVAQKMGYSTKSVNCEIIDDAELCECIGGGGGCEFGTDPVASDFTITSFTTDKTVYARGETMVITMTVLNSAGEMYKSLLIDTSSTESGTGLPLGFVGSWSFVDMGSNTYQMRLYIPTSTEPGIYNVAGGIYTDYLAEGGSILDIASMLSVTIT